MYLYNLETDIFIESIELTLENVNCSNSITLLLEDGNSDDKKKNIVIRTIDAIMIKIREIIDWIKSKLLGNDSKKYNNFLKDINNKIDNSLLISTTLQKKRI